MRNHTPPLCGFGNRLHTTPRSSAKIWYPYHPQFGHDVKVVRWFKKMGGNNVQVAFEDGNQACLPDWMLDEPACADIRQLDDPCIEIDALERLRRLLDAQPLLRRMQYPTSENILHAPAEYVYPKPPNDHSGFGGGTSAPAAAGGKGALHRPAEPDVPLHDRGQDCNRGEGQ